MSTNARIIVKMSDGTYKAVLVLFDGQVHGPHGVGHALFKGARTQEEAETVVSKGWLASIVVARRQIFGQTIAEYKNDGEPNPEPIVENRLEKLKRQLNSEFNYYWNGEKWTCDCYLFNGSRTLTERNTSCKS